ncbi:MAG: hypothetical protein LBC33_00100, partial [Mycoplasmataceae bacterium]|nr:hypothetical protein [Mycoplasmataceae bacterium]
WIILFLIPLFVAMALTQQEEIRTVSSCVYFSFMSIFLIYECVLIFLAYHPIIRKKNKWIYVNIKAHILTYYYDQKNFNGTKWQINRDTFLNNMKYIGRYNLLAIRLTEIGKNPTSKEWWKLVKLYQHYCFFVNIYCSGWWQFSKNKISKITCDPIKSPIKYTQHKMFFSIPIFALLSTIICLWNIELFSNFWPRYVFISYVFLFLNLTFIIWTLVFVFRFQSNFNKVLSAIKPLFPNDVYEDFADLAKNGIKNLDYEPSSWFVNRVKRVDKNDKWR